MESGKKILPFAHGMLVRAVTKKSPIRIRFRLKTQVFSVLTKFLCPYVAFLNRIWTSTRTRFRLKTQDFFPFLPAVNTNPMKTVTAIF